MRNPWDELRRWINGNRRLRLARLGTIGHKGLPEHECRPHVVLTFEGNQQREGIGVTYDDALIAALDALPAEVRR